MKKLSFILGTMLFCTVSAHSIQTIYADKQSSLGCDTEINASSRGQADSFVPSEGAVLIPDSSYLVLEADQGIDVSMVINQAIQSGTRNFYFKNGTYDINDSILLSQPDLIITGESKEHTILIQTGSSVSFLVSADRISLSNFTLKNEQETGIFVRDANEVSLSDTIIYGSTNHSAVSFTGKTYPDTTDLESMIDSYPLDQGNIIKDNTIYSPYAGDGIYISKQESCQYENNTLTGSRLAFYLNRNSIVQNNTFTDSPTNGIRFCIPARNNTISQNTIARTLASGIVVAKYREDLSDSIRGSGFTISNNIISQSSYFGIEVSRLDQSTIQDNLISEVDFSGIYLLYNHQLTVRNNHISDVNRYTVNIPIYDWDSGLSAGIFLDYMVSDSLFDHNVQDNTQNNCPYGIRIQPNSQNIGNTITNNSATGRFYQDVYCQPGSVTLSNNTMSLTEIIPTPTVTTLSNLNEILVKWEETPPYSNFDIKLNGTILHLGNTTTYTDSNLAIGTERHYRVRVSGGYWSPLITASTYAGELLVEATTPSGHYEEQWTKEDVTLTLSGIASYDKYQYSLTPTDPNSWIDLSGNTLILSTQQNEATYYFRAIDANGVVLSQSTGTLIRIDKTAPVLQISGNPTTFVTATVPLTILATAGPSGIKEITVSTNGSSATKLDDITHYSITENGEYLFALTTNAGASITALIQVTKIDPVLPALFLKVTSIDWFTDQVLVSITKEAGISGIKEVTVINSGGWTKTITNQDIFIANNNESYTFMITSGAGKTATTILKVKATNIALPKISTIKKSYFPPRDTSTDCSSNEESDMRESDVIRESTQLQDATSSFNSKNKINKTEEKNDTSIKKPTQPVKHCLNSSSIDIIKKMEPSRLPARAPVRNDTYVIELIAVLLLILLYIAIRYIKKMKKGKEDIHESNKG